MPEYETELSKGMSVKMIVDKCLCKMNKCC